jgi:hypothetical protein
MSEHPAAMWKEAPRTAWGGWGALHPGCCPNCRYGHPSLGLNFLIGKINFKIPSSSRFYDPAVLLLSVCNVYFGEKGIIFLGLETCKCRLIVILNDVTLIRG